MTLNPTTTVTLNGNIGVTTPLATFSIPVGSVASFSVSVGTVTASNINIGIPTTYATTGTLNLTSTSSITFGSTLDALGTGNLQISSGASGVSFGGNIGITGTLGNMAVNSTGTVSFGGSVATVNLTALNVQGTATTTFAAATTTVTATGSSGITFNGNLSGAVNNVTTLNLNTPSGPVTFGADVGVPFIFKALNINQAPSLIFTVGTHTVTMDTFTTGTSTLTELQGTGITTINAGTINFGNTIDGDAGGSYTLVLNAGTGTVALSGNVGATNWLGELSVTAGSATLGAGLTTINAGTITLAAPLIYATTGTLNMTGIFGITFGDTLDASAAGALQLNAGTQTVSFGGNIGASQPLGNLAITAGTTAFTGSVATITLSSLNISSAATFAAATTTITASGASGITFNGNLNGTSVLNLSATTTATITFGGNIGNTATFSQFNINQAGTINFTATTPHSECKQLVCRSHSNSLDRRRHNNNQ